MDKPTLKFFPADTVDTFPAEMIKVLSAVGSPEALVTDESQVSDFLINISAPCPEEEAALEKALGRKLHAIVPRPEDTGAIREHNDTILQALSTLMGREVSDHEHLGELARQLSLKTVPSTLH